MDSSITREEIEEMKEFLRKNPIDHKWDEEAEYFDSNLPPLQAAARTATSLLKDLGELPE
ncbi:MAG: hypothetical protein PHG73_04735 [Pygmaiobacter sp.]|nr:hypothetical protein [Pygmaiobacter sp.]